MIQPHNPRPRAFTLTELLIVTAILGTLASLLVPTVRRAASSGRNLICQANLRHLAEAYQAHRAAMKMDAAQAFSVADQWPLHLRPYLSMNPKALLCPEDLIPAPYFANAKAYATSDQRRNSWDMHLFDTPPVWEEMRASELAAADVPGVWKVNEEQFQALQLSERHNIIDELPQYVPGKNPGVYYYLVEDQRTGANGMYAGDDKDFEDIVFRIEETYSGSRTISVHSSGSTYCNFDVTSVLSEFHNIKGSQVSMECPGFAGQSYGMNWHADNTRQDFRMILAVDYDIDVVFVGTEVMEQQWDAYNRPRHLDKMNVVYTDGSVAGKRVDDIDPTNDALRGEHWNPYNIEAHLP
jgi:prepilin-type N-terminal cleavage/methylation domain-containing protein/prepilin-type processing-associated H-X9-DG protein